MTYTDKYEVEGWFNLNHSKVISQIVSFILIFLNLLEIWMEFLMREHIKQPNIICKSLVERHNSSSPLIYWCWFMVVVFHNILSFMTGLKNIYQMLPRPYKVSYSGDKGGQYFKNHGFLNWPNQLKHISWLQ